MKTMLLVAFVIASACLAATAGFADPIGGYPWGVSPATIASQTGAVPDSLGTGTLVKQETELGRVAYVTYRFEGAGLAAVGIQWDENIFTMVKRVLDRRYGHSRCSTDAKSCSWESPRSTIRLVEPPDLGVTLLVFSKRT